MGSTLAKYFVTEGYFETLKNMVLLPLKGQTKVSVRKDFDKSFNMFRNWFFLNELTYKEGIEFMKTTSPPSVLDSNIEYIDILYLLIKPSAKNNK